MRVEVDLAVCVRCCACVAGAPEVFYRDAVGEVRARTDLPMADYEAALEAMLDCPVGAIRVDDYGEN